MLIPSFVSSVSSVVNPQALFERNSEKTPWRGERLRYRCAMRFSGPLCTLAFAAVSFAHAGSPPAPVVTRETLKAAAIESATDNIGSGWCGRGMLSVLKKTGLGAGLEGGNGQDWEKNLLRAGWKPVRCLSPWKAPLGSVLVYLGDRRVGKNPRGTPGGYYGHVEMVALGKAGERLYVSDCARQAPGGTVRDNFTGRAWVPPGREIWKAPPIETEVATLMEERMRMAMAKFDRDSRKDLASMKPVAAGIITIP